MKVLFLNAYFAPEVIAYTHLERDIMDSLFSAGHEIHVCCPMPTRGVTKDEKKRHAVKHETMFEGQVHVHRFWAPQEKRNPIIRAFRYFWCNFYQYQIAGKYIGVDAIFAVSTPPTQGLLCGLAKKKLSKKYKRPVPFVYNLQDIFPDSLVTTGMTQKGSLLWKIGRKIENFTYSSADKIIVISQSMKRNIMEKGVPEEKIVVVSNWIDADAVQPVEKENNRLYKEYSIEKDKFTVVYAGNFGAAQGADVVLEAAKQLPDVQFVIFGGGVEFESAKQTAATLPNVIINGLLPQERVPEVYSLGDVCLITCKKGVGTSGMPSKTWSIMACNTPIIAAFDMDSELAEVLKISNTGVCVEPENANVLAEAIDAFAKGENQRYKGNGRLYVTANADKKICTGRYVDTICSVIR